MSAIITLIPILLGTMFLAFGGWQLIKLLVKLNVYVQLLINKEQNGE